MKSQKNCYGCGHSFESYKMLQSEGYDHNGKTYCNAECQMEVEVDDLENRIYDHECGLNEECY